MNSVELFIFQSEEKYFQELKKKPWDGFGKMNQADSKYRLKRK
jgi:hypothetical protein